MTVFSPYTVVNDRIFIKYGRYDRLSRLLYPSPHRYPYSSHSLHPPLNLLPIPPIPYFHPLTPEPASYPSHPLPSS
jgi:hypothetical protein